MGNFRLCIDPGHGLSNVRHGRYDPGAVSAGVAEADIALLWALTLKWVAIHEFGVDPSDVVITRDDSSDHAPVWRRDDMAVAAGCTHFLSIHCNAASFLAHGVEVFIPKAEDGPDVFWGAMILREAVLASGLRNRGLKNETRTQHRSLAVFRQDAKMKCCLLETGFITNAKDRRVILDRETRVKFARGVMAKMTGRSL